MSGNKKFKVSFDQPDCGWIAIEMTTDEKRCCFPFEHVPNDTICQLANALGNLLSGYDEATAKASDGPIEYKFRFSKADDSIGLSVIVLNETRFGKEPEEIFAVKGTVQKILRPFWKALRDLETKYTLEEYQERWREPFPIHEMRVFTAQFEKLKMNEIGSEKNTHC